MPKVSASIELLWQLACREAIAGRFAAIEPEHFCMALMKLAELPVAQIEKLSPNGGRVAEELVHDAQALRKALSGLGVDSTQGRRKLRATLGKGDAAYDGGEMHRSERSRALFDEAARLADEAGSEALTPSHLLAAIAANPTPAIREVVLASVKDAAHGAELPGILTQWGTDLTALAARSELPEGAKRTLEAKSVLTALQSPTRKGVFLISDANAPVNEVMAALACAARKECAPTGIKRLRVVDLTRKPTPTIKGIQPEQMVQHVLAEASGIENLVLRIPDIQDKDRAAEVLAMLKSASTTGCVIWVCRIDWATHRRHVERDAYWRRAATGIAVQHDIREGIPNEL